MAPNTLRSSPLSLLTLSVLAALSSGVVETPLCAQNPLVRTRQTQDRLFAGRFAGESIRIELEWDARGSRYTGTLESDGERYPCSAEAKGDGIRGSFRSGGEDFAFTATLEGDTMKLVSDGETMSLQRQGGGRQPVPVDPRQQPSGQRGGAGIALRQTDDGGFVVAEIAPRGPAARAGLKPGGMLRAVDGKSVEGMTLQQVGGLIGGPIGKIVVLTIETEDEVLDVMIERGALGAPQNGNDGPQNGNDAPEVGGDVRDGDPRARGRGDAPVHGQDAPQVLKPGTRVTWYLGSATLNGVRSQLVQDDKGNWVDPQTGTRYADSQNFNAAGAGYLQLDISAADADGIAGDSRNYLMMDPQQGRLTSSTSQAMVGDSQALGDYWMHPAKLAAMEQVNTPGYRVSRLRYPLDGREFDALAIETRNASGFYRTTYDLRTGLMIAGSTSTTGAGVPTVGPDGKVTGGAGATTITSSRLVNVRDLNIPWAGGGAAAFRGGEQLDYAGTYSTVIPGVPEIPMQYASRTQVQSVKRGFALCRTHTTLSSGYSAPQEGDTLRVFGAGSLCGLSLPPQGLRQLRPDTVLDEDPVTHFRVVFAGTQGDQAMIVEQGPSEQTQYVYDLKSGVLTNLTFQQNNGVGTTVIRVQLQGRR